MFLVSEYSVEFLQGGKKVVNSMTSVDRVQKLTEKSVFISRQILSYALTLLPRKLIVLAFFFFVTSWNRYILPLFGILLAVVGIIMQTSMIETI